MSVSKTFVLAGDATFTIQEPSGGHRTYRVQHVEANDRYPESYFAKLLTGSDNENSFSYLGKLDPFTGQVNTTTKSKKFEGTMALRLLNRVLARIWADDHVAYEQHGYRTYHENRCCRCGRKLTTPESVQRGVGPECAEIMGLGDAPVAGPAPEPTEADLDYAYGVHGGSKVGGPNLSALAQIPAGVQALMAAATRGNDEGKSVFHSDLGLRAGQWPDAIETDRVYRRGREQTDREGDLQLVEYVAPDGVVLTVFND